MQKKIHIKKGDSVMVITGESKGQKGRVLEVNRDKDRAIVEGIKTYKAKYKGPSGRDFKEGSSGSCFKSDAY
jgi:large subunit ribosomal protein L24